MTNLDLFRSYCTDIPSDDLFIEHAWLHAIQSTLRRQVWTHSVDPRVHPGIICANAFRLFVGDPACGKSVVVQLVADIMRGAADANGEPIIHCASDSATMAAMIDELSESKYSINVGGKDYTYHSIAFHLEELSVLFRSDASDLANVMNSFYDAKGFRKRLKSEGITKIPYLSVCIIAGCTPDHIKDSFNEAVMKQGLISRFNVIYSKGPRFYRDTYGIGEKEMIKRAELIKWIAKLSEVQGEVTWSPEARALRKQLIEPDGMYRSMDFRANKSPLLNDYYGRWVLHWFKTAIGFQFSESIDTMEVSYDSLGKSWKLLQRTEKDAHLAFEALAGNELYRHYEAITDFIASKEAGMQKFDVVKEFKRDLDHDQLESVFATLLETRAIRRVGEIYHAVKIEEINLTGV